MDGIIRTAVQGDASAIARIYGAYVRETTISFEWTAPASEEMGGRIAAGATLPWIVWEEGEDVLGYAYAAPYRTRQAYQWCVETSAYVDSTRRRGGIGGALYDDLFCRLESFGYVHAFAVIALPNSASVAFHEAKGFARAGLLPDVGFKLGGWHDVGWWYRRIRDLPAEPEPPAHLENE